MTFPPASIRGLFVAFVLGSVSHTLAQKPFLRTADAATQPSAAAHADLPAEAAYIAENDRAMKKMMKDMSVEPTGDVDKDFVAMMVPHHQGAIDMAVAVLRYGRNEQLKRLAQEIIVTQQEEIAVMRLAVGEPLPPSISSPTQPSKSFDRRPTTPPAARGRS